MLDLRLIEQPSYGLGIHPAAIHVRLYGIDKFLLIPRNSLLRQAGLHVTVKILVRIQFRIAKTD